MNKKQWKKEYEELLLRGANKKFLQKIDILRSDKKFLKDIKFLRKRWQKLIKKYQKILKQECALENAKLNSGISKADENKLSRLGQLAVRTIQDLGFRQDLIFLAKKHKLYPIENKWENVLRFWVISDRIEPLAYHYILGIECYLPKNLLRKLNDLNFGLKIENNETTGELEVFVQIFDSTSLLEIKKHWDIIEYCRDEIRKERNIKRSYPLKNLRDEIRLSKIDRKKISDYEKAELLWGDLDNKKTWTNNKKLAKEENRRRNKVKQLRHHLKKLNK